MIATVHRATVRPLKHDRGGVLQVLLSTQKTGNTAGFLGTFTLQPQEVFLKHYHPYSEECFYVIQGEVTIENDKDPAVVATEGTGVFVPRNEPHRLRNTGSEETFLVFFCSPLAPSPAEGHVLLEEEAPASV